MQYKQEDLIKIAIADIGVGMFVTGIEKNKGINLGNAGRVSNELGIKKLHTSGVKYVWVNKKLSARRCVFKPFKDEHNVSLSASEVTISPKIQRSFRTREVQHERAKKLISEAKGLAQKLLNQTFEGKFIEVNEIDSWADDMIERFCRL